MGPPCAPLSMRDAQNGTGLSNVRGIRVRGWMKAMRVACRCMRAKCAAWSGGAYCRFSHTVKWFHRQRRRKFHPSMRTPHQSILEYGERILIFSHKR